MTLHLRIGDFDAAAMLVETYHYSHRMAGNVQLVGVWHESGGLFGDYGQPVAAVVFSLPPTRWSEDVWELSRLVRRDDAAITLSQLVGKTVAFMKRARECDLLVSFADATQNHHGGIYQACSWNYDGQRDRRMDGVIVNGKFVPGRSANSRWGTQSPTKLATIGVNAEPHYDDGKHLYWRSLGRRGDAAAKRLGLRSAPYPKPDRQGHIPVALDRMRGVGA